VGVWFFFSIVRAVQVRDWPIGKEISWQAPRAKCVTANTANGILFHPSFSLWTLAAFLSLALQKQPHVPRPAQTLRGSQRSTTIKSLTVTHSRISDVHSRLL